MAKKTFKNEDIESLFYKVEEGDPRLVDSKPIEEVTDVNVNDLFTVVGAKPDESERLNSAPYSYWRMTFTHLLKNPLVILCLAVLGILLFFIIFGTTIRYYDPIVLDEYGNYVKGQLFGESPYIIGPNPTNWFGVCAYNMGDAFQGLDMWSCVWEGAQISLLLGVTVAFKIKITNKKLNAVWHFLNLYTVRHSLFL